ncbi:MAG: hypothetical protein WBC91_00640 [Phototrophicaceae bacterium]
MALIVAQPIIDKSDHILQICQKLLKKAPLNSDQRVDIETIQEATRLFKAYVRIEVDRLSDEDDSAKKRVRHQLRNHVNIIVGFSQLMIKELPDNLLLEMASIRQIYKLGESLHVEVDLIQ